MSRGMPSMTALLGLLALAGYQNRDKLAELLKGAGSNKRTRGQHSARAAGRPPRQLKRCRRWWWCWRPIRWRTGRTAGSVQAKRPRRCGGILDQ